MRPISAPGAPVRRVQELLRTLTYAYRDIPFLIPDGIFGEATMEGVMVFQRNLGLPVTGAVDQTTWEALLAEAQRVDRALAPPRPAGLYHAHLADLPPGQSSPLLYPIQGMLLALSQVFAPIQAVPPSGVLDPGTAENIRWLQNRCQQPETGRLDRESWELLAQLYETFVVRPNAVDALRGLGR